ncbi:GMP synthase-like glutamine amidotransferase [Paenibacillus phyllosphaerae]|uniref:GMP synthase-like glutamine amidotransferase n=1 Tax=Paenibacillus phyllosphaerae TaxID=274593 RepID=A0A7W5FNJ0_9BACL|nr:type 1 glutamine amidotransferase [Paenibacillus phyllosphaerae]MBB3111401.1 GMP synthase-like glutamine amidotransferase [Paenibacillus phyllosphaerae]
MNVVLFKHFDFDDPSVFTAWSERDGHALRIYEPAQGIHAEWLETLDLLIIMGGPMSVYHEERHPWLPEEKAFVKRAIDAGKKVLGICLGAQMIAEVLGANVTRNPEKEIGWHRMQRTGERHPWLANLPETFTSFSWHGDTFELPQGARHLAYSAACVNQAFAYGEHVLGLQFHLETTGDCIDQMLFHWADEIKEAPHIQSASRIREGVEDSEQYRLLLRGMLQRIASNTALHSTGEQLQR